MIYERANIPFATSLRDPFVACFDLKGLFFYATTRISSTRGRLLAGGTDLLEGWPMVVHSFGHCTMNPQDTKISEYTGRGLSVCCGGG